MYEKNIKNDASNVILPHCNFNHGELVFLLVNVLSQKKNLLFTDWKFRKQNFFEKYCRKFMGLTLNL